MPGTFSLLPRVSDPDMHHGTCVTHVPWCMTGLLTRGFLWSQWRGKLSRHSRRIRNPQFYVSGKSSMFKVWESVCKYSNIENLTNGDLLFFVVFCFQSHYWYTLYHSLCPDFFNEIKDSLIIQYHANRNEAPGMFNYLINYSPHGRDFKQDGMNWAA